jgi:hypothetical protein
VARLYPPALGITHSRSPPTHFLTTSPLYNTSARTTQKPRPLYYREGWFIDLLPSNGRPIVARVRFRGNTSMFTESLPSNRSIRHNIFIYTDKISALK